MHIELDPIVETQIRASLPETDEPIAHTPILRDAIRQVGTEPHRMTEKDLHKIAKIFADYTIQQQMQKLADAESAPINNHWYADVIQEAIPKTRRAICQYVHGLAIPDDVKQFLITGLDSIPIYFRKLHSNGNITRDTGNNLIISIDPHKIAKEFILMNVVFGQPALTLNEGIFIFHAAHELGHGINKLLEISNQFQNPIYPFIDHLTKTYPVTLESGTMNEHMLFKLLLYNVHSERFADSVSREVFLGLGYREEIIADATRLSGYTWYGTELSFSQLWEIVLNASVSLYKSSKRFEAPLRQQLMDKAYTMCADFLSQRTLVERFPLSRFQVEMIIDNGWELKKRELQAG